MTRREWTADDVAEVDRAFDVLRRTSTPVVRREPLVCRCGHVDTSQIGTRHPIPPVADMTDAPGIFALDNTPIRRMCRVCDHSICPDQPCIAHSPNIGHAVRNFYHPACIELGDQP